MGRALHLRLQMKQGKISKSAIKKAERHLKAVTPQFDALIKLKGPCNFSQTREGFTPFQTLVRSIISQQISSKASRSILSRLAENMGGRQEIHPENIIRYGQKGLIAAGISSFKANYIVAVADSILSGDLDFDKIYRLPDEEVIESLTKIRGIGRWTAEMFLIFCLGRPDIMALNDVGIIKGVQKLYGLKNKPSPGRLAALSEKWKPYRSIACWYLWRAVD